MRDQLSCKVDEALLARPGDLRDGRGRARRGRRRRGGEVSERLGDGPRSDRLYAHLRHVADLALPSPVDELLDELMELRCPQDLCRNRAGYERLLVRDLCRVVAGPEPVAADDRHHDDAPHAGFFAGVLQVPSGRPEKRGRRLHLGRRASRGIDDAFDAVQRICQAVATDYVNAGRSRHRDDLMPASVEQLDDIASHPSRRSRYRDLCRFSHGYRAEVSTTGRTSTAPMRAAGMRDASSTAASGSSAPTRTPHLETWSRMSGTRCRSRG